jgi:hypothetical protein
LLAVSDHPFSDLRVDAEGWLGPTVVSGESQVLQGRLTMNPLSVWKLKKATADIARPEIV